jgi:exodeoxyribonuclease V alpha subunit
MAWLPSLDLTQRAPEGLDSVRADVVAAGRAMIEAARAGDADAAIRAMATHRVLCAHRRGPFGALRWGHLVEAWLREDVPGFAATGEWYVGRPLLVTSNDADTGLFNGDTGVIVADDTLGVVAAFERGGEPLRIPVTRLAEVQTVHAMTVHKAQGSQFARVTVVMPPIGSPLLTRELMYTAMTRARDFVRLLGPADAVATAVRTPVVRASGLGRR